MDRTHSEYINCSYCEHITEIRNGDLLMWSESNDKVGFFSGLLLKLVRLMTMSDYGHVGIALWLNNELFVIEAVSPRIRLMPLKRAKSFYHVPVHIDWKKEYKDWLLDKVGIPYSFADALRAYFGKEVLYDERMQCVELANEFYKFTGLDFRAERLTPGKFVDAVQTVTRKGVYKVKRKAPSFGSEI